MRHCLYNHFVLPMTTEWYAAVIGRLPTGARVLDVGIGNAAALVRHAPLLRARELSWTGIDIDAPALKRAHTNLQQAGLSQVELACEPFMAHTRGPYDAIYFSGSFMLLHHPTQTLAHTRSLLHPTGRIYLTLTVEGSPKRWLETIKPQMRHILGIDFGRVTYEATLLEALTAAGFEVETHTVLMNHRTRTERLIVARPQL